MYSSRRRFAARLRSDSDRNANQIRYGFGVARGYGQRSGCDAGQTALLSRRYVVLIERVPLIGTEDPLIAMDLRGRVPFVSPQKNPRPMS